MIRAFLLGLTLLAGPALAEGFTKGQKAELIALAAASDCDLTMVEVQEALFASGVHEQVAEAIANDLIDRGQADIREDKKVLSLSSEVCP
jgi:hypothetical protein